jgi:hypothetical protein
MNLAASLEKWRPYALSLLRVVVALLFLQSGLDKFFGFPAAGPPLTGVIILAALIETIGGLLLLVGLFSRWAAFVMWPSPISWRMRQSHSIPPSMAETSRFSIVSCFSISSSPVPVPGAWITR